MIRNWIFIVALGILTTQTHATENSSAVPPKNYRVAFIGDAGLGSSYKSVLQLIKEYDAKAVLHAGDFDYDDNPKAFDDIITEVLGKNFLYLGVVGNHDVPEWPKYKENFMRRIAANPAAIECTGDVGVNGTCVLEKSVYIVLSGVGTLGSKHDDYIKQSLAKAGDSMYRICVWHKNHKNLQVGGKSTEVQYSSYDACREFGAFIATGHEHSYSRTKGMSSFAKLEVDKTSTDGMINLDAGKSFAFVQGLGGKDVRDQELCTNLSKCPWWGSIYTSNQKAKSSVLFCDFNTTAVNEGSCQLITASDKKVIDSFKIVSHLGLASKGTRDMVGTPVRAPSGIITKIATPDDRVVGKAPEGECR